MSTLDRCLEIVEALEQHSRHAPRRFEVTPEVVRELTDFFLATSDENRRLLSGLLSGAKAGLVLAAKGTEAAAKAIDTHDVGWIQAALIAHIIEGFQWDPRENMRDFIFLAYAIQHVDADIAKMLDEVKFLATEHALQYLKQLTGRNQINLKAHGFKAEVVNGQTRFVRIKA